MTPRSARTYAVLLSAASPLVYSELVTPMRFAHAVDAGTHGQRIRQVTGYEYEVMRHTPEGWRNARGESPQQVIARRWNYGGVDATG